MKLNLYQGCNELIAVKYQQTNPFKDIDIKATNTIVQLSLRYNFDLSKVSEIKTECNKCIIASPVRYTRVIAC